MTSPRLRAAAVTEAAALDCLRAAIGAAGRASICSADSAEPNTAESAYRLLSAAAAKASSRSNTEIQYGVGR